MASVPGIPAMDRRRSQRVLIRMPVLVTGVTRAGKRVTEKSEAIVISRHGALLKAENDLKPGSEVEIENPANHQTARYRVVWTSDRPTEGRWDVGLDFGSATHNIWGIEFPPADSPDKISAG